MNDLEHRLERLRSLYEQYFLGIEKIEPTVARKDVDRRIYALRKIQIRNTARKFKLQTLIQRYNTFQQYWIRICREIENGTYRRQMLRAERRLRDDPKSVERRRLAADGKPADRERVVARAAREQDDLMRDFEAVMDADDPLALAKQALDDAMNFGGEASTAAASPAPDATAPAPPPVSTRSGRPKKPIQPLELDLDLDFSPEDITRDVPAPRPIRPGVEPAEDITRDVPAPRPVRRSPVPAAPPRALGSKPEAVARVQLKRKLAPRASSPDLQEHVAPRRPTPPRDRPPAPLPKPLGDRNGPPQPPPDRRTPRAKPPIPPGRARPPVPGRPRPPTGPSPRAPGPRPSPPGRSGDALTDERVQALHAKLVKTNSQLNASTKVSVQGLAKQLRATLPKIQAKHGAKAVDFDVVVKGGKAVVRPKVKK